MKQNHHWRVDGNQGKEGKIDLNAQGGSKIKSSYIKDNKTVRNYCVIN